MSWRIESTPRDASKAHRLQRRENESFLQTTPTKLKRQHIISVLSRLDNVHPAIRYALMPEATKRIVAKEGLQVLLYQIHSIAAIINSIY